MRNVIDELQKNLIFVDLNFLHNRKLMSSKKSKNKIPIPTPKIYTPPPNYLPTEIRYVLVSYLDNSKVLIKNQFL